MPDEATHDGTSGNDTLTGAAGADAFVFGPDHGNDVIADFTNGEDVIDLSAFSTIADFSDLTITSDENAVTIHLGAHGGGTILLQGFTIADLDAEDFRFRAVQADPVLDGGGTAGDDVLEADDDGDRLDGGAGDDTLTGGEGADILLGREGDDTLRGGEVVGSRSLFVHSPQSLIHHSSREMKTSDHHFLNDGASLGDKPPSLGDQHDSQGSSDRDIQTISTPSAGQVVDYGLGPGMLGGQRQNALFAGSQSPRSDGRGNRGRRMDRQPLGVVDGTSTDVTHAPTLNLIRDRFRYPELICKCSKQLQMIAAREKDQRRRA